MYTSLGMLVASVAWRSCLFCKHGELWLNCLFLLLLINFTRDLKLSHSTVSTIFKDKERICEAVKGSAPV